MLLVSADLRVPRLHEMFGLDLGVGLSDILTVLDLESESSTTSCSTGRPVVVTQGQGKGRRGQLDVITSGAKPKDPAGSWPGPAMKFLQTVRG